MTHGQAPTACHGSCRDGNARDKPPASPTTGGAASECYPYRNAMVPTYPEDVQRERDVGRLRVDAAGFLALALLLESGVTRDNAWLRLAAAGVVVFDEPGRLEERDGVLLVRADFTNQLMTLETHKRHKIY